MKRKWLCLLVALAALFLPMGVVAERRMGQTYSITIEVDCLETAVGIMRALPGHDLHLNLSQTQASFHRRVDAWAFRHMQEALRELGTIIRENEHARHLGAELSQVETRIAVLEQEMARLTVLMAASVTIDVLSAVDMQWAQVSRNRDWYIGRRNVLAEQARTATLDITLTELYVPVEPVEERIGFGRRVGDSFLASWNAVLGIGGDMIVLAARIGIPLVLWLVLPGTAAVVAVRQAKRRKKPLLVPYNPPSSEGTEGDVNQ